MKADILSDVKVVIAEPKQSLRRKLADDVRALGCRNIITTGNLRDVQEAFYDGGVDILIGESELPEGSLCELIHDVRHGVTGDNPFTLAIALVAKPDTEIVRNAVNSGADDIIIKPVNPDDLHQRLLALSRVRKPFVVTSEYIGPDRRSNGRKDGVQIPHIKAPNPLHLRGGGMQGEINFNNAIARTTKQVNEHKVERHAYSIQWLMDRIIAVNEGEMDVNELDMHNQFERLNTISADISSRLDGTGYNHAAEMCLTLEKMTAILIKTPDMADAEEIDLLGKLTNVIKRKCNGNDPMAEAEQIAAYAGENLAVA
ncbi:MAG: response regulator [Rhodospirillaceae bacterium]|jgi:DNA-binding response OmpR family regulator|nr:response regulator [Rhodospirillaceae bacterium]MBT4464062.1 response regulator [Rhodospirillaceae bacterium]MBT5014276.1 response regulator [Rhodospirillaceae bacterium]MBT5309723.1 response regulator [Rhodospirillaceae bacterium]MBT6407486.1 response regulator [Rhodospirillaceae bacterium]